MYATVGATTNYNGATTETKQFTVKNATITFAANTGTLSGTGTLYTRTGSSVIYTSSTNSTQGTLPYATKSGYILDGWYTATSGGSKVLNENGSFTGTAVSGYTNTSSWAMTENKTLYAQYKQAGLYNSNGTLLASWSTLVNAGFDIVNGNGEDNYDVFASFGSYSGGFHLVISSDVTTIGSGVFDGGSVTSVVIPHTVTSIGNSAFCDCGLNMDTLLIPGSVKSIGNYVFSSVSIKNMIIEDGVTNVSKGFADSIYGMESITIGKDVTLTGTSTYFLPYCEDLQTIIVDSSNASLTVQDGVLFNKNKTELIKYPPCKPGANYVIPSTVTTIDEDAFSYTANLNNITIPSSVVTLGNSCFEYGSVSSVLIQCSLDKLPYGTFYYCEHLESVTLPGGIAEIGSSAFQFCSSLASISLPSSITTIGSNAFSGSGLSTLTLPTGLTSLGNACFSNCNSLTNVFVPGRVGTAPQSLFYGCDSLESVEFGEGITRTSMFTFYGCPSLKTVIFPSSITYIDYGTFSSGTTNVTSVTLKDTTGWYLTYYTGGSEIALNSTNLSNPATVASYFMRTYKLYNWNKH